MKHTVHYIADGTPVTDLKLGNLPQEISDRIIHLAIFGATVLEASRGDGVDQLLIGAAYHVHGLDEEFDQSLEAAIEWIDAEEIRMMNGDEE